MLAVSNEEELLCEEMCHCLSQTTTITSILLLQLNLMTWLRARAARHHESHSDGESLVTSVLTGGNEVSAGEKWANLYLAHIKCHGLLCDKAIMFT